MKVVRIAAGLLRVVTDVSVQAEGLGGVAASEFAQDFISHAVAAVAIDVGNINIHSHARSCITHIHLLSLNRNSQDWVEPRRNEGREGRFGADLFRFPSRPSFLRGPYVCARVPSLFLKRCSHWPID